MADELDLSISAPGTPAVNTAPDDETTGPADTWADDEAPQVSPDTVRAVLLAIGAGVSVIAADEDVPEQWRFTPRELEDLTPPVTNIINSRPALRRAVAKGDYAVVAMHLAGYMGRNLGDGRRAKENRGEDLTGETGAGVDVGPTHVGAPHGQPVGGDGPGLSDLGARRD